MLVGSVAPVMLAGLLYGGSGLGLLLLLVARRLSPRHSACISMPRGKEWAWLAGAIPRAGDERFAPCCVHRSGMRMLGARQQSDPANVHERRSADCRIEGNRCRCREPDACTVARPTLSCDRNSDRRRRRRLSRLWGQPRSGATPGTVEPHAHCHVHAPLVHSHPHYPDVHHRHPH